MKLPRDLGGQELAHQLEKFGYCITRQTGSQINKEELLRKLLKE
jgi:predicted RNA binding protein YcfA (HicA-like mRNA interferase family)